MTARRRQPGLRGARRFRLSIEETRGGQVRLLVLQERPHLGQGEKGSSFEQVAWAQGLALDVAHPLIAATVRANGGNPAGLLRRIWNGQLALELDEVSGARVALALLALQPLRKHERMQAILQGIEAMSEEETLYWFARVMRGPKARVLRALRILLARE